MKKAVIASEAKQSIALRSGLKKISILFLLLLPTLSFAQKNEEPKTILVKAKPPLLAYIKFCNLKGGPVALQDLLKCDSFSIAPDNVLVKRFYHIKSFSMSLKTHGKKSKVMHLATNGSKLSKDMKVLLESSAALEDVVIFYDFIVQNENGDEITLVGPSFFIVRPNFME